MRSCNGRGECLSQGAGENEYNKNNIICDKNCEPIQCPNYLLCNTRCPQQILDAHDGLCYPCNMMFGKWQNGKGILEFYDNRECPICLDEGLSISQPKCSHTICVECFGRCYRSFFESGNATIDLAFPCPELEDEYDKDPNNKKWYLHPLIKKWLEECDKCENSRMLKYEDDENLRKCPICRAD